MAKRGKTGKRDRSGRLLREKTRAARIVRTPGNDFVQRRAELFSIFQGGKANNEIHDAPGQAWAAGLFDNLPADAIAVRDVAREFSNHYWRYYANLGAKTANIAGSPSGRGDDRTTAGDRRFASLDEALGRLSSPARQAVYAFCIATWAMDDVPPFVERLVNEQRLKRRQHVVGLLPTEDDRTLWVHVCTGLLMMVSGTDAHQNRSAA